MKKTCLFTLFTLLFNGLAFSQLIVFDHPVSNSYPVSTLARSTYIYTDSTDDWLIQKAAQLLQQDMELVTSKRPILIHDLSSAKNNLIIIGSINNSDIIKKLAATKKINIDSLTNKWETFKLQVIDHPFKGVDNALVIVGSDKRGTAFGVFELSEQLGVSPWVWWADIPVKKKKELYIKQGAYTYGPPSVKYRGIFINDEAPAFSGWTKEKFGGVNHLVYEKMFELLLRLKANFLWPAMWGNAFNDDDTLNPVLADKYGIVMSTSHHEPMLRAQQEWKRYGKGAWDYTTNDSVLRAFWKKGIENMGSHESLVTIGMRGDGDKPMAQGTATALLEKIVADQRKIIEDVTHKPAASTPQVWALYKEVQDYYDKGMRVPDDVTLLLCDDNWGNIRKLPRITDKPRSGGYGIYYHFDYVGGPRNYKWLNTNSIARTWEQMHLAYAYGVRQVWVVNVGDLKPMEYPINFFLDYAWDTKKWNADNIGQYAKYWAAKQFGNTYATAIAELLNKYTKYNARRKPELLDANTYSIANYNEAQKVTTEYNNLLAKAEKINTQLPAEYKDAFFELVLHPIKACANLQELYTTVAWNKFYASQKNVNANYLADKAKQLYLNDSLISNQYNHMANGKWDHMMDQTHIGYTYWQQPNKQKMPEVKYVAKDSGAAEIILIKGKNSSSENGIPKNSKATVFYEQEGYVSIEAAHYTKAINTKNIQWQVIKDIGKDGDGITTSPVTESLQSLAVTNPQLQYEMYVYDTGQIKLQAYFSPTLNFHNDEGLRYAISIDEEQPQTIVLNKDDNNTRTWEGWVANNIIIKTSPHHLSVSGKHTIKYWMISPAVVLQKIVVDFGGLLPSYLGPTETRLKR